jgi:hypothetical protein
MPNISPVSTAGGAPTSGTAAPASAPATSGQPTGSSTAPVSGTSGVGGVGPGAGAPTKPGGNATPEEKFLYKRAKEDGTFDEIDISDYKHRIKVDGVEQELSLKEAFKERQLAQASFRRFEEAAKTKALYDKKLNEFKEIKTKFIDNPKVMMNHLKTLLPKEQLMQMFVGEIKQYQEYMALPPQVREAQDRMTKAQQQMQQKEMALRKREEAQKQFEANQRKAKVQALQKKYEAEWPQQLQALGVPNDPALIKASMQETARLLRTASKSGHKLTPNEAMQYAVAQLKKQYAGTITSASPEALRSFLGDETLSKISQAQVSRVQQQPGRTPPETQATTNKPKKQEKILRPDDLRERWKLSGG